MPELCFALFVKRLLALLTGVLCVCLICSRLFLKNALVWPLELGCYNGGVLFEVWRKRFVVPRRFVLVLVLSPAKPQLGQLCLSISFRLFG